MISGAAPLQGPRCPADAVVAYPAAAACPRCGAAAERGRAVRARGAVDLDRAAVRAEVAALRAAGDGVRAVRRRLRGAARGRPGRGGAGHRPRPGRRSGWSWSCRWRAACRTPRPWTGGVVSDVLIAGAARTAFGRSERTGRDARRRGRAGRARRRRRAVVAGRRRVRRQRRRRARRHARGRPRPHRHPVRQRQERVRHRRQRARQRRQRHPVAGWRTSCSPSGSTSTRAARSTRGPRTGASPTCYGRDGLDGHHPVLRHRRSSATPTTTASPRSTLALVAEKAYRNGALTPQAWRRTPISAAEVLASGPGQRPADPVHVLLARARARPRSCCAPRARSRSRRAAGAPAGRGRPHPALRLVRGVQPVDRSRSALQRQPRRRDGRVRGGRHRTRRRRRVPAAGHRERRRGHAPGRVRVLRRRRAGEADRRPAPPEIGGSLPVNTDGGCIANGEPIGASGPAAGVRGRHAAARARGRAPGARLARGSGSPTSTARPA